MALFYRSRRRRRIKGVNEFFDLILMLNNEWLRVSCVCVCERGMIMCVSVCVCVRVVYQWFFTYLERVEEN